MAPVIGSFFKMAVPFIVILPGLLGLVLLQNPDHSRRQLVPEEAVKSCAPLDISVGPVSASLSAEMIREERPAQVI